VEINRDEVLQGVSSPKKFDGDAYTVQPGDTLGLISLKVYGTFSRWPVIADANRALLGNNPDMLRLGMVLSVPVLAEVENGSSALRLAVPPPALNEDGTYNIR